MAWTQSNGWWKSHILNFSTTIQPKGFPADVWKHCSFRWSD